MHSNVKELHVCFTSIYLKDKMLQRKKIPKCAACRKQFSSCFLFSLKWKESAFN